jgi:hypothetical protein
MEQTSLFSALAIKSNQGDFSVQEITEEAVKRSYDHADKDWKRKVIEVIQDICTRQQFFSADDIQDRMEREEERTHDNSALGAMIKKVEKMGLCKPSGYTKSKRKGRHSGVLVLWRSNVI